MTLSSRSLVALVAAACATTAPPAPVADAPAPPPRVVEECGALAGTTVSIPREASVASVVRAVSCATSVERPPDPDSTWHVARHLAYDERSTGRLEVAAMIVACVASGACDPAVDPESFAWMVAHAESLGSSRLDDALDLRVPPPLGVLFHDRLRASLALLRERARGLDARRRARGIL